RHTLANYEVVENENSAGNPGSGKLRERWRIEMLEEMRPTMPRETTNQLLFHSRPSVARRRLPPGTTRPEVSPASSQSQIPLSKEAGKKRKWREGRGGEAHIVLRCDTKSKPPVMQSPKSPGGWPKLICQRSERTMLLRRKIAEASGAPKSQD